MVWLHSIRSSETPEIRVRGREMWAELERGIPHADDGADGFRLLGVNLDIDGAERIPENLTPTGTDAPVAGSESRVSAMALEIHEMCCMAHHSRDAAGAPLHRHFTHYPPAAEGP
jgi:hypothetical protein